MYILVKLRDKVIDYSGPFAGALELINAENHLRMVYSAHPYRRLDITYPIVYELPDGVGE
jgi:hypothetical protein